MTETREKLKAKAMLLNGLLSEYVDLHNNFTKNTNSILSIFKKINFSQMSGDAYFLFQKLKDEVADIEVSNVSKMDKGEVDFYECLREYAESLKNTVYLLFLMLKSLDRKANGEKLNFTEHSDNNQKYKDSIREYATLGEKLNSLYNNL